MMVLAAMSGTNGQWTSSLVNRTASFICIGLYNVRDRDSSALSAHDPVSDNAEKEHILDGPLKMSGEKLVSFLAIRTHAFVMVCRSLITKACQERRHMLSLQHLPYNCCSLSRVQLGTLINNQ